MNAKQQAPHFEHSSHHYLLAHDYLPAVEYTSPLDRAQRAEKGLAILRTIKSVTPLSQVDPGVMLLFNAEAVARELCEINGAPAKLLRTSEQVAQLRKQSLVVGPTGWEWRLCGVSGGDGPYRNADHRSQCTPQPVGSKLLREDSNDALA